MHLTDLLTPARVITDLAADDQSQLLATLADLLVGDVPGNDALRGQVLACLRERERLGTTALGCGVAIPHGRLAGLTSPIGAFVRLAAPIADFAAPDGQAVDLVFALAVPEHFTHQHLLLLSELAGMFGDIGFRAQLRAAPDATKLLQLLVQRQLASAA